MLEARNNDIDVHAVPLPHVCAARAHLQWRIPRSQNRLGPDLVCGGASSEAPTPFLSAREIPRIGTAPESTRLHAAYHAASSTRTCYNACHEQVLFTRAMALCRGGRGGSGARQAEQLSASSTPPPATNPLGVGPGRTWLQSSVLIIVRVTSNVFPVTGHCVGHLVCTPGLATHRNVPANGLCVGCFFMHDARCPILGFHSHNCPCKQHCLPQLVQLCHLLGIWASH